MNEITVERAILHFREHLLEEKDWRARGAGITEQRLELLLGPALKMRLSNVTPTFCETLYLGRYSDAALLPNGKRRLIQHGLVTRPKRAPWTFAPTYDADGVLLDPKGRPAKRYAPDTHRNTLLVAQRFMRFCVRRGWIEKSPLEDIEGFGARRSEPKESLSEDETNKWLLAALKLADQGDLGAVASIMALVQNMRAGEVVSLTARQIDGAGSVLQVARWRKGKTNTATRKLNVPTWFQPYVLGLKKGRQPEELVFGQHVVDWVRLNTKRICGVAKVTEVDAHGLRRTHASLAEAAGETADAISRSMGWTNIDVGHRHYIRRDATLNARQSRALAKLKVLPGGGGGAAAAAEVDDSEGAQ